MKTLIKNVILISPYDLIFGHCIIIENGKISGIPRKEDIDEGKFERIIDGDGKYLSPGFIDIHNHGNSGYDVMDGSEKALDKMANFHLKNGVTSFLATVITSSYENMEKAIENIAGYENKNDRSQLLGIHLEGPFFSMEKKGAQPGKYIKEPSIKNMGKLIEKSQAKLKMVSLAPEKEGSLELISYLRSKDIVVAMGHSMASFEETKLAIGHGATVATHLYNGMKSFSHREPGIVGACLLDDRVYCELIYDRVHLHDGAVEMAIKMKGLDRVILVSDAMRAAGLEDGDYELGGQKVVVKDGAARLESGSLAGSTLNLRDAVYNMVDKYGMPMKDAIRMASLTPAEAMGIDKSKGSIEVGKDADLLLLDENINIKASIIGGSIFY